MDLLDDIFSEPSTVKVPVRAKFQPKAKPRPQKGPSSAGSTHAALAIKEQAIPSGLAHSDSSNLFEPNDSVNKNSNFYQRVYPLKTAAIEETLLRGENVLTDGNLTAEVKAVGSLVTGHSEIAMSKTCADGCLSPGTTLGSQGAEDVIGQSPKEGTLDMHMLDASATQAAEDTSGFPNLVCASALPFRPSNGDGLPILSTSQESRHSKETVVGCAGDFQIDMQQKQETVDFSFLEVVDITGDGVAPSGTRADKFQPMPKGQSTRKTNTTMVVSHLPDAANVPSENQQINGDSLIHAGELISVSDLSHVRLDGEFGTEATVVQLDTVVPDDVDSVATLNFSKENENTEKRMTSDAEAFSHSLDGGISLGVEATEDGYGYLGGVIDEIQFNSSSPAEAINEVVANSDEYNDDCHSKGETSENRLHNSEKVSSGNGKPSRKRRNEAKPPEESTKKARKKFPHATRRKRSVDKSLLEAPDEIELRKVPIRDLIILSEHKECQANKQAAVVQRPTTSERRENTLPEHPTYNENDEAYGSDQGTDSFNNPSTSGIIEDTGYFNYQSYMDRKHKRWSKHETELFYQGLQEFGSDFTMIQQSYFPDRSRHQIKLKYKKEEREHPMRIHDALTTRAKGLSHFEVLIQKLQEQERAGQEKAEQSGDDNLIGSTFKEDEGGDEDTHETHATSPTEPEQNGGSAALNQQPDNTAQVESFAKSDDSEEELNWDEYKSEL